MPFLLMNDYRVSQGNRSLRRVEVLQQLMK